MDYNKNEVRHLAVRLEDTKAVDNVYKAVALSSDVVLSRGWYTEQLSHRPGAINLERAVDGLPLLHQHDQSKIIGRVDNVSVDKSGKLRGDITFANNPLAAEIRADVNDGFLRDLSIGYRGDEVVEIEGGYRLDKWTLMEASIVSVPADIQAGLNRSINIDNGR